MSTTTKSNETPSFVAVLPRNHREWTCVPVLDCEESAESELEIMPRGHFHAKVLSTHIPTGLPRQAVSPLYIVVNDQRCKWWGFREKSHAQAHMRDEKRAYRGEGAEIKIVACTIR